MDENIKTLDEMENPIIEKEEEQPKTVKTDWDSFSEEGDEPVLLSEFEHKAYLVTPRLKKVIENPEDLLVKDLQLSRLDRELAYIYSVKASCSEDWRNLGLNGLAKRRMTNLIFKLSLLKSVEGFERILQTVNPTISGEMAPMERMSTQTPEEAKSGGGLFNVGKFFKKSKDFGE